MKKKKKIILTFDLDFWHSGKFLKKYLPQDKNSLKDFVKEPTEPILDLLDKYNQKATFFVLGEIARKYPRLIKKISQSGHEIASHGYSHKTLPELGEKEFEKEIIKTNQVIEEIIGQKPIGFRAPNFSLNYKTKWAFKILEKYNFRYDSSIHPLSFKTFKKNFPRYSVKELPPSLGGIYFRILPLKAYLALTKLISKTTPSIIYLHPYELFDLTPRIESVPWLKKKIKYFGIKNALTKFEKMLKKINLISIKNHLDESSID